MTDDKAPMTTADPKKARTFTEIFMYSPKTDLSILKQRIRICYQHKLVVSDRNKISFQDVNPHCHQISRDPPNAVVEWLRGRVRIQPDATSEDMLTASA